MVKNVVVPAVVLGIIGLVVGYFLFGGMGNGYIPIATLLGVSNGLGEDLRNLLTGIVKNLPVIRRNILLSGLVGVIAGMVIGLATQRRR